MERTEFREQFFAETLRDPYAHMAAQLYARAWAEGYEQACRDAGLNDLRLSKTFSERCNDAIEHATKSRRESEAHLILAMAQVGSLLGDQSAAMREP